MIRITWIDSRGQGRTLLFDAWESYDASGGATPMEQAGADGIDLVDHVQVGRETVRGTAIVSTTPIAPVTGELEVVENVTGGETTWTWDGDRVQRAWEVLREIRREAYELSLETPRLGTFSPMVLTEVLAPITVSEEVRFGLAFAEIRTVSVLERETQTPLEERARPTQDNGRADPVVDNELNGGGQSTRRSIAATLLDGDFSALQQQAGL